MGSTDAEGNVTGKEMVVAVPDAIQPASGAPGDLNKITTYLEKPDRTDLVAAANERLAGGTLYTYWDNHGQFGNKNPRKTGPYSNSAYTGAKEYQSFATPHPEDR